MCVRACARPGCLWGGPDDERNLFNVAFRHLMGTRRASLRVIRALIERAEAEAEPQWMVLSWGVQLVGVHAWGGLVLGSCAGGCCLRLLRQRDERLRVKEEIEADMKLLCAQLLDVVTKKILVGADADSYKKVRMGVRLLAHATPLDSWCVTQTENLVYFLKLAGDYHRYLTDVETGDVRAAQVCVADYQ